MKKTELRISSERVLDEMKSILLSRRRVLQQNAFPSQREQIERHSHSLLFSVLQFENEQQRNDHGTTFVNRSCVANGCRGVFAQALVAATFDSSLANLRSSMPLIEPAESRLRISFLLVELLLALLEKCASIQT